MPTRRLINSPIVKATRWTVRRLANETQWRPGPSVALIYASVKAGTHCREHASHFRHPFCKWKIIMTLLTTAPVDVDGPCSQVSKITPVFMGRENGPYCTRELSHKGIQVCCGWQIGIWKVGTNEYVSGVYLDLQKAFDAVDHSILLWKLYNYGIRGVVHS